MFRGQLRNNKAFCLKEGKLVTYYIWDYLIIINLLTFLLFGLDKRRAKKHKWRIEEKTLFLFCFLGGSLGGLMGMYTFRHKTLKKSFTVGIPVILIIQLLLIIYLKFK